MNELTKHILLLGIVAGALFFTNLGASRLWDRDEPRNAGCAQEMLQRGDWVVPVFNDELRAQKPVLLYWLMMAAYACFGTNEFAARFWSAALGLGTVFATYLIGRRLFNGAVALLSSLILSSTIMFDVAARAATPDSVLIFCGTMALMIYVLNVFKAEPQPKPVSDSNQRLNREKGLEANRWFPDWKASLAIYLFLGLATLAKGPVGFLLPMAMMGMFMLIMRAPELDFEGGILQRWFSRIWRTINPVHFARTVWAMRPITAAVIVLLVAAPWYVLVGLRTEGDFIQKFFWKENFARATTAMENHSGGLWYYPATLLLGFFPWSIFAFPITLFVCRSIRGVNRNADAGDGPSRSLDSRFPATCFLLCWVMVQVGLFSLASTKLPSYVTPCYPALALLTGLGLSVFAQGNSIVARRWYQLASAVMVLSGLLALVGTIFVAREYLNNDYVICLIGVVPILGGTTAWWMIRKEQRHQAVMVITASSVLFCWCMFGFGTVAVDRHRDMATVLRPMRMSEEEVATYGVLESSWVFYAQRRIFELAMDDNPLHPRSIKRAKMWKPKPWVTPESFASTEQGPILTTNERVRDLLDRLPGYEIVSESPYFLNDESLVLVAPKDKPYHQANAILTTRSLR